MIVDFSGYVFSATRNGLPSYPMDMSLLEGIPGFDQSLLLQSPPPLSSIFPWKYLKNSGPIGVPVTAKTGLFADGVPFNANTLSDGGGSYVKGNIFSHENIHAFKETTDPDDETRSVHYGRPVFTDSMECFSKTRGTVTYESGDFKIVENFGQTSTLKVNEEGDGFAVETATFGGHPYLGGGMWPVAHGRREKRSVTYSDGDPVRFTGLSMDEWITFEESMKTSHLSTAITLALNHENVKTLNGGPGFSFSNMEVAAYTTTSDGQYMGVCGSAIWSNFTTELLDGPVSLDVEVVTRKLSPMINDRFASGSGLVYGGLWTNINTHADHLIDLNLTGGRVECVLMDEVTSRKFADSHGKFDSSGSLDDVGWCGRRAASSATLPPWYIPRQGEDQNLFPINEGSLPASHHENAYADMGHVAVTRFISADGRTHRVTAEVYDYSTSTVLATQTVTVSPGVEGVIDVDAGSDFEAVTGTGATLRITVIETRQGDGSWLVAGDIDSMYATDWHAGLSLLVAFKERRGVRWGFPEYEKYELVGGEPVAVHDPKVRYKKRRLVASTVIESTSPGVEILMEQWNAWRAAQPD